MIKQTLARLSQSSRKSRVITACVVLILIAGGFSLLRLTAAGFFAFVAVDQGTLSGNVQVVTDTTAIGGKAVEFKAASTPPPPPDASGASKCPLPAYPSASCTGVPGGVSLSVINGDLELQLSTQKVNGNDVQGCTIGEQFVAGNSCVVNGKDIRGCIQVRAANTVIRNSKISCNGYYVVHNHSTNLLIEDTEISCNGTQNTGLGDSNMIIRRSNIHSCENGFNMEGDVTLEDSFIHDLSHNGADPHPDGIQIVDFSGHDITIKHNTIYANNANAAIISPTNSATPNTLIEANLMAGGGWTLYCPEKVKGVNFRVMNNHFSTIFHSTVGIFGPMTHCENETISGNVFHESGAPVN